MYKDQLAKSVLHSSLERKRSKDITYYQLDIFITFGVLNILLFKNSEEFRKKVIKRVCEMRKDVTIVEGKCNQRQSQDWVECTI